MTVVTESRNVSDNANNRGKDHPPVHPIYDELVSELDINPSHPLIIPPPTKRARHRAGKLTGQVWNALTANPHADTSGLTVEDTQEIPVGGPR